MERVSLFLENRGMETLISQLVNDGTLEVRTINSLEDYKEGMLFIEFGSLTFMNVVNVMLCGINLFYILCSRPGKFRWYHSFIISRCAGIIYTPFGRKDLQWARKDYESRRKKSKQSEK